MKRSILKGGIGIFAAIAVLAPVIGWSITAICMATFVALAVIVWRRLRKHD